MGWDTRASQNVVERNPKRRSDVQILRKTNKIILKNSERLNECQELFKGSPINIATEVKRHLKAAIGSSFFKEEYINEMVKKWTSNSQNRANIANSKEHVVYRVH